MISILVNIMANGSLRWVCNEQDTDEGLEIILPSTLEISNGLLEGSIRERQERKILKEAFFFFEKTFKENDVTWINPKEDEWLIDLDLIKDFFPQIPPFEWLKGKVRKKPEIIIKERDVFGEKRNEAELYFYIDKYNLEGDNSKKIPPIEIKESLKKFKKDFPDSNKVAFIMMQYGKSEAYKKILQAIKETLDLNNITGVIAEDKEYHEDIYYNVLTYIYGCSFGIALFERIEKETFNPNVSLEVGYMLALCLAS